MGSRIPPQDWEQLIQDFRGTAESRNRWLSLHSPASIVEQALQATSRKDFNLKLQILVFLDENAALLLAAPQTLDLLLDALRSALQSPTPPSSAQLPDSSTAAAASSAAFKEQLMVTTTSSLITLDALENLPRCLEALIELLLGFINRPNHSPERHLRAAACECLRQLETEYPCLLHAAAPHLLALCQSERTHAAQAYTLLLTAVLSSTARHMSRLRAAHPGGTFSLLSSTLPLVPYSVPPVVVGADRSADQPESTHADFSHECMKEFRRAISFLLEKPNLLTEYALLQFVGDLCGIAARLDLQFGLLKLQFWSLLHLYTPVSCHALLTVFTRFPEALEGEETEVYRRLVLFSKEYGQALTVRLLALHWLTGLDRLVVSRGRPPLLASVARSLYPEVFDPLSLKAAKLECLARSASMLRSKEAGDYLVDGLVCLSSYKWLPSGSTETRLLFRTLHRFLVYGLPHCREKVAEGESTYGDSVLFRSLQETLVNMARDIRRLVDRILGLLDRFLGCEEHRGLGEWLLRMFSEKLVPSLPCNMNLPAYFPLMERIAESSRIPPGALILSLGAYVRHRVAKGGGNEGARLWLRGSEVLTVCRTLLIHHQSSRVFAKLTALFGYLCLSFPDIEVRDNARFYLRMLVSVPGNKLRDILMYGDERMEDPKPQLLHVPSFLSSPSPRAYQGKKRCSQVSSFIHLTRETPLLVRSSWSLVLHGSFRPILETFPEAGKPAAASKDSDTEINIEEGSEFSVHLDPEQVPRMMDSETAETLTVLRQHFSQVPESGVNIQVVCRLRLKFQEPNAEKPPDLEAPCIYAVVVSFSTSGVYGPIADVRIPYLRSEPPSQEAKSPTSSQANEDGVKLLDSESHGEKQQQELNIFNKVVRVVLEPKQPVPTLIDCQIVFTDEDAQTVQGQLESLCVGIEDLFMKPPVPEDLAGSKQPEYLSCLFNALWFGCSGPGKLGTEIFLLKGGRQGVGLQGSESVKLLEAQADRVVSAVETYLAEFVVSVSGSRLKQMAEDRGRFVNAVWVEEEEDQQQQQQKREDHGGDKERRLEVSQVLEIEQEKMKGDGELGCFLILVFLPPRYHLLLRMEVSEWSTLIRIRTDYWPSLAHVDEFLESFIIPATL